MLRRLSVSVAMTLTFSRMSTVVRHTSTSSSSTPSSEEPNTPEAIRDIIQKSELEQHQKEMLVDSREVVFASGASADHRPRIAAAEAFDVAAAALPRPPNFCYVNVSIDYAGMIDAPEVVWFNLCRINGVTPSTVKASDGLQMLGGTVCQQKPGGGFIQVVLGCVPDIESDVFTFDTVPQAEEIHDTAREPPAACFAFLDTRLALQYEHVLSSHLNTLASRLGKACPLVGGLYPSIGGSVGSQNGPGPREDAPKTLDDSVFFVNDRVYKGSAAAVILRSRKLRAHALSVVPSISVGSAVVDEVRCEGDVYTITKLAGQVPTEFIKSLYLSDELAGKPSKVFFGFKHGDVHVPVSFIGNPKDGVVQLMLPGHLELHSGDSVELLVDDTELDTEAAASLLISAQKRLDIVSADKDIAVARESRRNTIASNVAAFHFSYAGLNTIAKPDIPMVSLGNANVMFAPSVLQRCVGRTCPNSGIFCPGQVATVGDTTAIFPRSSTYCFLEGLS